MRRLTIGLAASTLAASLLHSPVAMAHEPYGGCKEGWRYPGTTGFEHCQSHGWMYGPRSQAQYRHVEVL